MRRPDGVWERSSDPVTMCNSVTDHISIKMSHTLVFCVCIFMARTHIHTQFSLAPSLRFLRRFFRPCDLVHLSDRSHINKDLTHTFSVFAISCYRSVSLSCANFTYSSLSYISLQSRLLHTWNANSEVRSKNGLLEQVKSQRPTPPQPNKGRLASRSSALAVTS